MTVYVDDAFIQATVPNGGRWVTSRWCHLTADSTRELHAMADRIGLRRSWVQYPGTSKEHHDVTPAMRAKAIAAGAVQETSIEMARRRVRRMRADREQHADRPATAHSQEPS